MSDFDLNVNKIGGDLVVQKNVKVITEQPRMSEDEDIYDLRRQIEARQNVKDFIRAEILRYQQLLEQMTRDIISLDLKLHDRKPMGEPKHLRRLYAPGTEARLAAEEESHVDTEVIE